MFTLENRARKVSVAKKILIIQLPIGIVFRMKVSDFYYKYYFLSFNIKKLIVNRIL